MRHNPGPMRRYPYGRVTNAVTCSCGKRVTSQRGDEALWRAFDKHVKRAEEKEAVK